MSEPYSTLPNRVAVLGPGLLGGSILMALRQRYPAVELRAWSRREEMVEKVKSASLADIASTDLEVVLSGVELIVLCTPVETMPRLAAQIAALPVADGCVVTDVGSAKAGVVAALEQVFSSSRVSFLGSHPMAGSEKTGLEAARAELFNGQVCILTPTLFTTDKALEITRLFWRSLGCRLLEMSAEEHDRKIARISHLPHLAAAITTMAAMADDPSASLCAGNGFRDTTRVSSGDPDLWTGIISENRAEIIPALRDARDRFSELVAMLENMDEIALRRFLLEAKILRDSVPPCV